MTLYQQRIANLIVRVQREFWDAGSGLTAADVQDRVGIDEHTCAALLDTLVDAGVLTRAGERYVRAAGRARAA